MAAIERPVTTTHGTTSHGTTTHGTTTHGTTSHDTTARVGTTRARPTVPPSHADLLDSPLPGLLTTELTSGRLQTSVVWYWTDGADVLISTMTEFAKARNLRARPRATLLVLAPDGRWVELRAHVAEDDDPDPMASLDAVGVRYTGAAPYFGAIVPVHLAEDEHPVTFRLVPTAVVVGPTSPAAPRGGRARLTTDPGCGGGSGAGTATEPDGAVPPDAWAPGLPIPASHVDLLDRPILAALSTRLPDGAAQTQPVWCAREGDDVLLTTTAERRKGRNLAADPRATLVVVDPANSSRWLELRADAEVTTEGAETLADRLAREYTGAPAFYGHVAPSGLRGLETRVVVRLRARRIVCDAIHA